MSIKKILIFISLNFFVLNICLANSNTGTASSEQIILKAKQMCKSIGYKIDTEKFNDCVLKLTIANKKKLQKKQNVNSEYTFTGNETFGTPKKSRAQKKHEKKVARYMGFPDDVLCIAYINNYGIFKKAKQQARAEAVRKRNLDCNQFRDAAFYDKKSRDLELIEATERAFDGVMDAKIEEHKQKAENYRSLSKNQTRRCKVKKVGSYWRETCY